MKTLLFAPSIDSIVSRLSSLIPRLERLIQHHAGKIADNSKKINELEDQNMVLSIDQGRAHRIIENLNKLLG